MAENTQGAGPEESRTDIDAAREWIEEELTRRTASLRKEVRNETAKVRKEVAGLRAVQNRTRERLEEVAGGLLGARRSSASPDALKRMIFEQLLREAAPAGDRGAERAGGDR